LTEKIAFAKPAFSNEDIEEFKRVAGEILRSGWLTSSEYTRLFEEKLASYLRVKHCPCLNSCTAALHSILRSLDIGAGDEVIVPSNTFAATVNSVLYVGAKPILVDSDPETYNVNPNDVQEKVTSKTRAVMVVHVGGNPCDMRDIVDIARASKACVIEDAAHALGSKYKNRMCGSIGTASALSFYPTKIITTGEGGAVATDDDAIAQNVSLVRNQGRPRIGPEPVLELGYNYRITELSAALGLLQLKRIEEFVEHRNLIARIYDDALSKIGWMKRQKIEDGNRTSYYAYIVRLTKEAPVSRDELRKILAAQGIETSVMFVPVHKQPYFLSVAPSYKRVSLPWSEFLGENSLALPMSNSLTTDEARRVAAASLAIGD